MQKIRNQTTQQRIFNLSDKTSRCLGPLGSSSDSCYLDDELAKSAEVVAAHAAKLVEMGTVSVQSAESPMATLKEEPVVAPRRKERI